MRISKYTREEMLDIIKGKSGATHYTTQEFLNKIVKYVEENGSTRGLSFADENLTGIDLGQSTIQQEIKKQGYSEEKPPPWYSGDLKQEELRKRPYIIASARDPNASEVISKKGINLEGVDFSNAILVCANLEGADLAGANFQNAKLHYANLSRARLWDANFTAAHLSNADLSMAALQNADFSRANLNDAIIDRCLLYHVFFKNTEIRREQIKEIWEEKMAKKIREAYLFDLGVAPEKIKKDLDNNVISEELLSEFKKNGFPISRGAIVTRKFNLSQEEWSLVDKMENKKFIIRETDGRLSVYGGRIIIRKIKKDSRVYYNAASIAYNRLKNNFVSIGRHSDAGWAFIKEKRMERKTFGIGLKRFVSWLMDLSCGYGEQPWKVIIISMLIVIGFGFGYWILDGIETDINIAIRWYDYFVFSLRNFVTLGLTDLKPVTLIIKILSSFEAASGIGLFALLMYSFGRRLTGR